MMRTIKSKTTAAMVAPNRGLDSGVTVASLVMIAANAICVTVTRYLNSHDMPNELKVRLRPSTLSDQLGQMAHL
jgi:hypothetical protein